MLCPSPRAATGADPGVCAGEDWMVTKFGRTCFAGFLGTIVVTCMVTFASPTLMGGPADIAAVLARMLGGSWLAGMAMHFLIGTVALPVAYLTLLNRRLPGGPALRGLLWGIALWTFSQAVVIQMTGGGMFSAALGGLAVAGDSLIGHLAYGLVLGVFAGEPYEHVFALRHERVRKTGESLRRAA
jgi:hypothetical protein